MHKPAEFFRYPADAERAIANMDAAYEQVVDLKRQIAAMPASLFWVKREGREYLAAHQTSKDSGTTLGPRNAETELQLEQHTASKKDARERLASLEKVLVDRVGMCRPFRLPRMPDRQGEILRELDYAELLGTDLMVVGTNAFAAYEMACRARFPVGNEETEDFDLAWCRGSSITLASRAAADLKAQVQAEDPRPNLMGVLKAIDSSYKINQKKPYQALSGDGYEVELLAAPSAHPLPGQTEFEPMQTLVEQEWLLRGTALQCVVPTIRGRACPLFVPDPRWMALHKLWLAEKPERNPNKKPKDARQGNVLLDATRYFLMDTHPLDIDFVLDLPEELRPHFNAWAASRQHDPGFPRSWEGRDFSDGTTPEGRRMRRG